MDAPLVVVEVIHSIHVLIKPLELVGFSWDHVFVNHDWAASPCCVRIVSRILHLSFDRSVESGVSQLISKVPELDNFRVFLLLKDQSHGTCRSLRCLASLPCLAIVLVFGLTVCKDGPFIHLDSHKPYCSTCMLIVEILLHHILGVMGPFIMCSEFPNVSQFHLENSVQSPCI